MLLLPCAPRASAGVSADARRLPVATLALLGLAGLAWPAAPGAPKVKLNGPLAQLDAAT